MIHKVPGSLAKIYETLNRPIIRTLAALVCVLLFIIARTTRPDVPFLPSTADAVSVMLELGRVGPGDRVVDLGCGDGRIVVAAVRIPGVQGRCVDIDSRLIAKARENALKAGVADRIHFLNANLFNTDISDATVVMLYLDPKTNLRLRPKLWSELKPGTRVVSNEHDMGDWKPEAVRYARPNESETGAIYLWIVGR